MAAEPEWIEATCLDAIDPSRSKQALIGLSAVWPSEFPPLKGVIEEFPLGERALLHLLSVSAISADKLIKDPEALLWLASPEVSAAPRGAGRMRAELAPEKDLRFISLRKCKGREMLRIAVREVTGVSSVEQTTRELSDLAGMCVQEVLERWSEDLTHRWGGPQTDFAVLGMGKFGGRELNYSSDIDVIFVYGDEGHLNPNFSYHEFFSRLAAKIVETFSANDSAGSLFRIDLRLRPEGDSGPLVRSLESMENYYAGYGETWERMALIKARGVAGSEELAYEFSQRLQAFCYPRTMSPDLLDEIARIKQRIEREIVGADRVTRHVKLGHGGIREIEFVVQALQLLHGARHAFLHERNTLKALLALEQLDILPKQETDALAEAYRFLRTVEHRLQIEGEQQTHTIPEDMPSRLRLARSLGFASIDAFEGRLAQHTQRVRSIFDRIIQSNPERPEPVLDYSFFEDPVRAQKTWRSLGEGSGHVAPRTRRVLAKLEPLLLAQLRQVAEPDAALNRLARYVEGYGIRGMLFETLVVNPKLLELLVRLFDSSRFLTEVVLRRPQLIEEIARGGLLDECFGVDDYAAGLARNDEKLPPLAWVRVYRRGQILRILLRDILGIGTLDDVQAEYSSLAEACLVFCQQVLGSADRVTVVALGKFGGGELLYGADLDVVFVGEDSAAAAELVTAMSQKTNEGIVFPIDPRLRPEGEKGMLIGPLDAYRSYFANRAQLWEAQALTKARPVVGPGQEAFLHFAQDTWHAFGARPNLLMQIDQMHERVVRERGGGPLDLKAGGGGLMTIEFLTQALQMKHGIWEPNTLRALAKLRDAGVMVANHEAALAADYRFLRRCESVLRRMDNSSVSKIPPGEKEQTHLALRLGYHSRDRWWQRYNETRESVRGCYARYMSA